MTLAPLFAASAVVQLHVAAAVAAFALGTVQLAAPKGTIPHRLLGWIWAGLIAAVAASAFFIHTLRIWGEWSPFHVLAVFTLLMVSRAVWRGHRHQVAGHRRGMIATFVLGLVLPALIALMPGRIIHSVIFGG
ncbi:MAG: DUF2306 domain-containing protein [Stellaceae bacterium]